MFCVSVNYVSIVFLVTVFIVPYISVCACVCACMYMYVLVCARKEWKRDSDCKIISKRIQRDRVQTKRDWYSDRERERESYK